MRGLPYPTFDNGTHKIKIVACQVFVSSYRWYESFQTSHLWWNWKLAVSLAVLCYDWDGLGWLKGFLDERWVSTSFQTTHNWVCPKPGNEPNHTGESSHFPLGEKHLEISCGGSFSEENTWNGLEWQGSTRRSMKHIQSEGTCRQSPEPKSQGREGSWWRPHIGAQQESQTYSPS